MNDGVVGSSVAIVIVPVLTPKAAGVPITVKVAVPFAAIVAGVAGEIAEIANPAEPVIEVKVIAAVPTFLTENDVYAVAGEPVTAEPTGIAVPFVARIVAPFNTCTEGVGGGVPTTDTFNVNEGVVGSLVTMVIVPAFAAKAAGVPVTVNVAVPFGAIVAGVVGVTAETTKPAEPVIEVNVNAPVPLFLTENDVYAVAGEPIAAEPTEIAGALLFATIAALFNTCNAGTVPVTEIFTTNEGVVGSLVTIVIVPAFTPATAGVPVTVKVAVAFIASDVGVAGVTAVIANPAEPVIEVKSNAAVPTFLIENDVYAAAGVPVGAEPIEMAGMLFVLRIAVVFNT